MWIIFAVCAAFVQNLRFMLQKHLAATGLTPAGATFARFVWSVPMTLAIVGIILWAKGLEMPVLNARFFGFAMVGGVSQILATVAVVKLFSFRNFAVASTFKKTETLQAAILGIVILGDLMSPMGWVALMIGLFGMILLSVQPSAGQMNILNRATGLGIGAGFLFGVSGVAYRAASMAFGHDDFVVRALITLSFVVCFQTLIMSVYLRYREPAEMQKVFTAWRVTFFVGLFGMLGSMCWFMAFTLQNVAYVKMVGQIELVFAALGSYFFFKERIGRREMIGILFVMTSIIALFFTL
jgi:drug/metabolite transporter (DMT)-like permease